MKNLITEYIDIWTSAQTKKANGGRGRNSNTNGKTIYGIKKLRELILELAVRGKLVPQDPSDEPASVLLEKIAKEKDGLIREGKIKKQKILPEITEDEKLFDLPEGWEWVRLQQIIQISSGDGLIAANMNKDGRIPVFGGNGITGYHDQANITKPTLVIGRVGYYCGSVHITPTTAWITDNAFVTKFSEENIFIYYLYWLLKGTNLKENENATAQPVISGRKVYPIIVGLPPTAEQHRIVAKVDELMELCDQLEKQQTENTETHQTLVKTLLSTLTSAADHKDFSETWKQIANHFDILFTTEESIDQLKQAILQLAVMGKLVEQNPEDEPASELLDKISKEKEKLIKQGKINKQKPFPEISESEKPFELPDGWAWARFPELGEFGRGKSKHRPRNDPKLYSNGKYPLVQTGDVARANGVIKTHTALYNDEGLSQSRLWPKGTMCITIAANIADSSILGFESCFPDSVVGFIPSKEIGEARYFEYFMRTMKERLSDFAPSTAQKNINLGILQMVNIPLPPKNELKRIVGKINELFFIYNELKNRIAEEKNIQAKLSDSMVAQVSSN